MLRPNMVAVFTAPRSTHKSPSYRRYRRHDGRLARTIDRPPHQIWGADGKERKVLGVCKLGGGSLSPLPSSFLSLGRQAGRDGGRHGYGYGYGFKLGLHRSPTSPYL